MGNSLRCCVACIFPCGALDVIRIVHANGHVEEVTGTISAGDVMKANPKHVLRKHSSDNLRIIILSPHDPLEKGHIYFLLPRPPTTSSSSSSPAQTATKKNKKRESRGEPSSNRVKVRSRNLSPERSSDDDRYLAEILSEKRCSSSSRSCRRGRVGIWRPHLESISEEYI